MSDDQRPVIIKPTVDATGVAAGAEDVQRQMRSMAQAVAAEGQKAGAGVAAIGKGAENASDKTEAETRRMIAALQRANAAAEAGGRGTAAYYEAIARQRNLPLDQLRPYIDGLRAAEDAQKKAAGGLGEMGVSARQTAAALRGVPAQFTDIVTALQGGQNPFTVILQQGGQLKDMFGGAGAAARALGGYLLSLVNPFTLLAAGAAAVGVGMTLGSREAQDYERALVLTGNAAGTTASRLADAARTISAGGGITQSRAAEVLTQIAQSGDVAADSIERYAKAAIELERAGGPAAEETAKAFADLGRDPVQASLKLTQSVRYLSAAQLEQLAVLDRQGRSTEAARLAQEAYAKAIEDRSPQLAARLGYVERAWLAIKDAAKQAGDAVLDIGRQDTLRQQVAALDEVIARAQRLQQGGGTGLLAAWGARQERAAQEQKAAVQEQIRLSDRAAQAQAQSARQASAGAEYEKMIAGYRQQSASYADEVARFVNVAVAAGRNEQDIQQGLLDIRRKYADLTSGVALQEQANAAAIGEERIRQELQRTQDLRARGAISEREAIEQTTALDLQALAIRRSAIAGQLSAAVDEQRGTKEIIALRGQLAQVTEQYATRAQAGAQQVALANWKLAQSIRDVAVAQAEELANDNARAITDGSKAAERAWTAYSRYAEAIDDANQQSSVELANLGRSTAERKVAARQLEIELDLKRKLWEIDHDLDLAPSDRAALRQAYQEKAAQQTADAVSRIYVDTWEDTTRQMGQSLSDAIMNGGQNAAELLKNYFRTLVLQPVIESIVRPLAVPITALLSGTGSALANTAAASGGAASLGSSVLGIGSALSSLGTLGTLAGTGFGATLGGASLGSLLGASGAVAANGSVLGGISLGLGAVAPYAIAAAAVYALGKRLFGRTLQDSGVEGSFGAGGDFSGSQFAFYKGGLLRSNKTTRSPLDSALEATLDAAGAAANLKAAGYAQALGLPVQALDGFTQQIKVSLKGLSDEQAQQAVQKVVDDYQEALLGRFRAQLGPLQHVGETLAQTAERLVALQTFSGTLNDLGGVFSRVAGLSVDAREQFIAMAGGVDALKQSAQSFAQQYYSRDEIAGLKARDVQGVLRSVGINADLMTKADFRRLVDSTDVGTAAGQQRLAGLLSVADEFAQVADYLAEVGGTLSSAATQAPATAQLASLFAQPAQAQVDAIDNVATWTARVYGAIRDLTTVVQSGGGGSAAAPSASAGEVNGGYVYGAAAVSGGT